MWHCFTAAFFCICMFLSPAYAADINLNAFQTIQNGLVTVTVENNSALEVIIDSVGIELGHQRHEQTIREGCGSFQKKDINFKIGNPSLPGSYLLTATVRYINDGKLLSLKDVRTFSFRQPASLDIPCRLDNVSITGEGQIRVASPAPHLWRLILPEEIDIQSVSTFSDYRIFFIRSRISGFRNSYPYFAVAEDVVAGVHRAGVYRGSLSVVTDNNISLSYKGYVPSGILLGGTLLFSFFSGFLINSKGNRSDLSAALIKYASRVFFLALSYYCLRNADVCLQLSLRYIDWRIYHYLLNIFIGNLNGGNYLNFFRYFIDAYFVLCLLLMFPYLYWLDRQTPVSQDKYVSFLKTLFSVPGIFIDRKIHWDRDSKLGILTILVKVFFVPIMVSWSINSIYHLKDSTIAFQWNIYSINAYLVALFIFFDTTIFAVGYLVESPYLKNEIKSIEPTLFGWLVCLWCYPPFNAFSFKPLDFYIIKTGLDCPVWGHMLLTCIITSLWMVFVWASIALGFKASNLTNRGIVVTGPYRVVRHPAYSAKVLIWIIQGIFFGQFGLFILMGFVIIYMLRVWTEERHLSMDPDYVEYKRLVKWRFIPGVI